MAAAAAIASAAQIPDSWVERNSQLFRTIPPGVERSRRSAVRAVAVKSEGGGDGSREAKQEEEEEKWAGCMTAMLINTETGVGYIDAPAGFQPASYFRDVANHPNILATFIYTARRKAGFLPDVMGQQLSQEEWKAYVESFNAWLSELDAYWFYVTMVKQEVETFPSNSNTSGPIVDALSKFVLTSSGEVNEGDVADVTERITRLFELASEYMVEKNIPAAGDTNNPSKAVKAGFQHEAFGSPGPSNPSAPISFTITTLSKSKESSNSPATIQYSLTTMNRFTFRLNSSNISANADALARGTTLLSTKVYCDFFTAPLEAWTNDRLSK